MPTIICHQCEKPWTDDEHSTCPSCGADPADGHEPLERQTRQRVTVNVEAAAYASKLLDVMATLSLPLGLFVGVAGVLLISDVSALVGILLMVGALFGTPMAWGLLTAGSAAAAYVANRSD